MTSSQASSTENTVRSGMVHFVLSHSYVIFLAAVLCGLVFDIIFAFNLFSNRSYQYIGAAMIVIGSAIIYWAQSTSAKSATVKDSDRNFAAGPYRYSRNPTHLGLTIMTLGLALVLNSLFSVIFLIISSLITKFIFLRKEEALLEKRYGQPYRDYKKQVSTWV